MENPGKNSVDYELLGRFFSGEADPAERERVEVWLDASEANRSEFEALRSVWDLPADPRLVAAVDVDAAWKEVRGRMRTGSGERDLPEGGVLSAGTELGSGREDLDGRGMQLLGDAESVAAQANRDAESISARVNGDAESVAARANEDAESVTALPKKSGQSVRRRSRFTARWVAAAVLFLGIGIGTWQVLRSLEENDPVKMPSMVLIASGDETREVVLPDSSVVTLNRNSQLSFPKQFAAASRKVTLVGEAFFEVKRDTVRPFLIDAGQAQVRVLGTSFNVRSSADSVDVAVKSGTVAFAAKADVAGSEVVLKAGKKATYFVVADSMHLEESSGKAHFWRDQVLTYRRASIGQISKELEALFGVEIDFENPELADCPVSTTFNSIPLDSILKVLSITLNMEMTPDGNRYLFSGTGCGE